MPNWAYTLAAHLEQATRELFLFDTQFDQLEDINECDLYFFSGINQDINHIKSVHNYIDKRFPNAVKVIGGPICWSLKQAGELDQLVGFDHIFVGDGEGAVEELVNNIELKRPLERLIESQQRFDLSRAKPMHQGLLKKSIHRYYGGVVEVSRGCPFLCEFCDIRVLQDNNRANNMPIQKIITELGFLTSCGVNQVTLSCDNFIGDLKYTEELVDAIIAWKKQSGSTVSFYTWVTINLYQYEKLLRKMREAGFDLLFIGVESFNQNSLLETAKVQNASIDVVHALRTIHSFGFIVVGGFIFGFDSDDEDFAKVTLAGIKASGLISGDPNWLTALPGTPLYHRMKLAKRLRKNWDTHGAVKFQTNIKYLLPTDFLINEFLRFTSEFSDPVFQLERFRNYINCVSGKNYVKIEKGFGDLRKFLRLVVADLSAAKQFLNRFYQLLSSVRNISVIVQGLWLVIRSGKAREFWGYYQFWLFTWSNTMVKYKNVTAKDFDIESVATQWGAKDVLPDGYMDSFGEPIPENKIKSQRRITRLQLEKVIENKKLKA